MTSDFGDMKGIKMKTQGVYTNTEIIEAGLFTNSINPRSIYNGLGSLYYYTSKKRACRVGPKIKLITL